MPKYSISYKKLQLMTFKNAPQLDKFIFKLSILTICALLGSLFSIIFIAFYGDSYIIEKKWVIINIICTLFFLGTILYKFNLNLKVIYIASFFLMILLPIVLALLPIKVPQNYVGLRKVDEEGYIVTDKYCLVKCESSNIIYFSDFAIERKYYSWRYAELLGRTSFENNCCDKRPFNNKYLFVTFLSFELTFEYFPILILFALLLFLYEYYTKRLLKLFEDQFVRTNYNIRKINVLGVALIIIIIIYNIAYLNALKN